MNRKKQIIIYDRVEYYKDFIINLIHYIFTYYIDDGSFDDNDIEKFYSWCFDKVCDEFKEENVNFSKNKKVRDYFKEYFYINYFYAKHEDKQDKDFYLNFWNNVFNPDNVEHNKVFLAFVEIYSFFDETINERKSIKEKNEVV